MSHLKIKTTYNQEGAYGSTDEKTLYCHHNNTVDVVTFYDEDGKLLFSVSDTLDNHLFDAMKRLFSPYKKDGEHNYKLKEGIKRANNNEFRG